MRRLLQNVSSLLKPGGYFLGITPDSSTIWYGTKFGRLCSIMFTNYDDRRIFAMPLQIFCAFLLYG